VRSPLPDTVPSSHDVYSAPWGLGNLYRRDIEQADVAALMAALLGVSWPVNSVGVLPDTDLSRPGYLVWDEDADAKRLEAGRVNALVCSLPYYDVPPADGHLWCRCFSSTTKSSITSREAEFGTTSSIQPWKKW
jgi:hypothetical protein